MKKPVKRQNKECQDIIEKLRFLSRPEAKNGMSRFGIKTENAFGISIPELRAMARRSGKNHKLALELWETGYHEARILACFLAKPHLVTENQMEKWVSGFDSWDLCDQCCMNLFDKSPFAWKKAVEWSKRNDEFVKRAGFAIMATLAVHDKRSHDREFKKFFSHIKRGSRDSRNYVKKAVNWALRQIGKRNSNLNKEAIALAKDIYEIDNPSSKWVASDALRELTSWNVKKMLARKRK